MLKFKVGVFVRITGPIITYLLCLFISPVYSQSMDELYKQALKEGGTLNFYGTLAQINAEKILPVFEKRFPGIKVNHVDATADKLAARAITEARGGQGSVRLVSNGLGKRVASGGTKALGRSAPARGRGLSGQSQGSVLVGGGYGYNYQLVEYEFGEERGRTQAVR